MQAGKQDDEQPSLTNMLHPFHPRSTTSDVCVVGCGPAGLALSAELAKQGLTVCLLGEGTALQESSSAQFLPAGILCFPAINSRPFCSLHQKQCRPGPAGHASQPPQIRACLRWQPELLLPRMHSSFEGLSDAPVCRRVREQTSSFNEIQQGHEGCWPKLEFIEAAGLLSNLSAYRLKPWQACAAAAVHRPHGFKGASMSWLQAQVSNIAAHV